MTESTLNKTPEMKFVKKGWGHELWIGKLLVKFSDCDDINLAEEIVLEAGQNFYIYQGLRHQMLALEDSELFEFSTEHFDSDSHRIAKGD